MTTLTMSFIRRNFIVKATVSPPGNIKAVKTKAAASLITFYLRVVNGFNEVVQLGLHDQTWICSMGYA